MAGTAGTGRPPVKTNAHRDIERQLGAPKLRDADPGEDDFELPPGYVNRYDEHRQAQAVERRTRREALRTPPAPQSTPRAPRAPRAPRPAPRRTSSPSLADPTGGRLPIGFDGEGLAGMFFGAVFYALVISVADYGTSGPKLWFKAKFLNQPAPAAGAK